MTDGQSADPQAAPTAQGGEHQASEPATANPTGSAEPGESVVPSTTAAVPRSPVDSSGPVIVAPPPDYNTAGVPSLDFVRDKIEGRYARSLGSTELAAETPEARSLEEQAAERAEAAQEKLAAIRRSLRDGSAS